MLANLAIDDLIEVYAPMWHSQWTTLRHILNQVRLLLKWAHRRGVPVNCYLVSDFQDEMGRTRYQEGSYAKFEWQDMPAIYEALGDLDAEICAKVHYLAPCRIGAIRQARWKDVLNDEGDISEVWAIPRNYMKGSKIEGEEDRPLGQQRPPHFVPVTPELRRLLCLMQERRIDGAKWVFPSTDDPKNAISQSSVHRVVAPHGGNNHGARHALSTWAADAGGIDQRTVDMVLDHKSLKGAWARYNRATMIDQKREALEAWERFVTGAQVVDLTRARA